MRAGLLAIVACAALGLAADAYAQSGRPDVLWARFTNGASITLDGVLSEAEWAQAESVVVRYGFDTGIPGSGWRIEGGTFLPNDSTYAVIKVLAKDNQFYMGAVVRDKSIGGSSAFNRFDGFLMAIKDHAVDGRPAPPSEYLYSWWYAESTDPQPAGQGPNFWGRWANWPPGSPRDSAQIANWDAATVVNGLSNDDAGQDVSWTTEMRFNLAPLGYDITQSGGDIVEWNVSVYDCDWFWPLIAQFSANRVWYQGPWGNSSGYNEVRLFARPDVTVTSGPVPASSLAPELLIPEAASAPVVDGDLSDAAWSSATTIQIQYGNDALQNAYPGLLRWRAGEYQPAVNGGTQLVLDPNLATVKYCFFEDSLFVAFDVADLFVGNSPPFDRWDGAMVLLQSRVERNLDNVLLGKRLSFHFDAAGQGVASDDLPSLGPRSRVRVLLKPNTTCDTLGTDFDEGYTAEMVVDLTQIGYPAGLGDKIVFLGINLLDGDSITPFTDSYSVRAWWAREYENTCCPPWAYLGTPPPVGVGDEVAAAPRFEVLGAWPNPARETALLRYSLPAPGRVRLEVYDLGGRRVASRDLGVQSPGARQAWLTRDDLGPGMYFYRIGIEDPAGGAPQALGGKVVFLK